MKDGRSFTRQGTGREFMWDFDEEARRIRAITPGLPIAASQFEQLIGACRNLEMQARADLIVQLTVRK